MTPNYTRCLFLCLYFILFFTHSQNNTFKTEKDSIKKHLSQSIYFTNEGQITKAISEVNAAIQLAKKIKNTKLLTSSYSYYATIYKTTGDFKNAETYYKKIILEYQKTKNHIGLSANYNSYADLLIKMGRENDAITHFNNAIDYAKLAKSDIHQVSALINLSDYYFNKKNIVTAKNYAYNAYELTLGLELKNAQHFIEQLEGFSAELIGISELHFNNFKTADIFLKKALNFFKKDSIHEHIAKIEKNYANYYIKNNNFKTAVYHQKNYVEHLQKHQNFILNEKSKQIEQLKQFEDNILKLELAEKKLIIQKQEKKRLWYFLIFALFFSMSFIIISLILKRKNKFLKLLKEEAIQSSKQKSKFIAMITHELKTPLYTILGYSNMLYEEAKEPKTKTNYLAALKNAASYLLNMVNNILSLSKLESNKLTIENTNFNLPKILKQVVDTFEFKINENKNTIELNIDKDIPRKLHGDHEKISQILTNLIDNANKFTLAGTIHINLKLIGITNNNCFINFEIKDNGIGIEKHHQNTVFESFSENAQNINRKFQGSGLGLSVVKQLLNLLGSEIELSSEIGQGSCFSFVLKVKSIETELDKKNDAKLLKNTKALIVEDNKVNQLITLKTLTKQEIKCDTADNGLIALNLFKEKPQNHYQIILMDLHMPIMNGYEATLKIRAIDKHIPIIALTAVNLDTSPENLKQLGLSYSISKPFKTNHLIKTLLKYIKQSKCITDKYQ